MMLESLRKGRAVATGEFLLDEERARQKLQNFQLANPHYYVLEFVKFAHLMGAEQIDFKVEPGQLEMRFDGDLLSATELTELYAAAFMRRQDLRQRARRHLAIGVNVAGALGLRELIVEVGGEEPAAVRVADDAVELCEPVTAGLEGTRIYLRRRVSPSVFFRSLSALFDDLPEAQALADRARFSSTPIFVNDARISRGMRIETRAPEFRYEYEGEVGFVAASLSKTDQQATVLQHGVWISTDRRGSPYLPFGVQALVDSPLLTPNLTQSAFVQDEAWQALHERITKAALQAVIEKLKRVSDHRLVVRAQQFRQLIQSIVDSELFKNLIEDSAEEVRSVLEALPVFEDIFAYSAGVDEQISIADAVVEIGDSRVIHFSTNRFQPDFKSPVDGPILLVPSSDLNYFGVEARRAETFRRFLENFADQARDMTDELDRRASRAINLRSWQLSPWSVEEERLIAADETNWGGLSVRVALFDPRQIAPVSRGSGVYYILDGKMLAHRGVEVYELGFFIEIAGDLQPDEIFELPLPTPRLDQAKKEAVKLLVGLLDGSPLPEKTLGRLRGGLQEAFQWDEWPRDLGGLPDPDKDEEDGLDAIVKRIMAERRQRNNDQNAGPEKLNLSTENSVQRRADSLLQRLDQLDRGAEPIEQLDEEDIEVIELPQQPPRVEVNQSRRGPSPRTRQGRAIFKLFVDHAPPQLTPRIFQIQNLYVTGGGGSSAMICDDRQTPIVDGDHPAIAHALEHPDDEIAQKMAALAIYAALDNGTDPQAVLRRRGFVDSLMGG